MASGLKTQNKEKYYSNKTCKPTNPIHSDWRKTSLNVYRMPRRLVFLISSFSGMFRDNAPFSGNV